MTGSHRDLDPLFARQAPTLHEEAPRGEHYLPPAHVQLLEKLEHLSRYSHFILVVEGVSGAGKSTLAEQFFPDPDDNSVHACCISAHEGMGASELLTELVEQLRLEVAASADDETRLQAVVEHAELLCDISRSFLIAVDDGECLADDALDLLLNQLLTISNPDARPHLVFFATPKLRETLEQAQFQPVLESSCHFMAMEPLDAAALDAFVHHSFPRAYPKLTEKAFKRLLNESFGLPGRVPRVLKAILKGDAAATPKKEAKARTPKNRVDRPPGSRPLVILGLLAGLLAAAGGATWWLYDSTLDSSDRLQLALPVPLQQPSSAPEAAPPPLSLEEKLAQAEAELIASRPEEPEPEAPTLAPEPTALADQLPAAPVRVQPTPEPEQASTQEPAVIASTAEPPPKKTRILALPAETAPQAEAVQEPKEKGFLRERELLSWEPSGYTLQVLGARKEKSVTDFISAHPDNKNLYYFSTNFKGKPWYVVVYGQYRTRELAMSAIAELPPELRQRRPWARSVEGVQDDIRRP